MFQKIAIIGTGAMGQLFAAHLSKKANVFCVDIDESIINEINENGILVDNGDTVFSGAPIACIAADLPKEIDLFIVFTKGFHTEAAIESVSDSISRSSNCLTLQNGIGHDRALSKYFDKKQIISGVTTYPADRIGTASIKTSSKGHCSLGQEIQSDSKSLSDHLTKLLNESGLHASWSNSIEVEIWKKLIFNSVLNTVTAACNLRVGETRTCQEAFELSRDVFQECMSVAAALNIPISRETVWETIESAQVNHVDHITSMAADMNAGRRTEIDYIGGAIARLGQETSIDCPTLSALTRVIKLRTETIR